MFIFIVLFLAACSNENDPKEHLAKISIIALTSIMEKDKVLSDDIKYIAIDLSNIKGLTEQEEVQINEYFKDKFEVDVMNASLKELEEKGYYNTEIMALEDGVLLKIETIDFKMFNKVYFEGSKYRSAKGAIGVEGTIHFKSGKWKLKESKETWIS